MENQYRNKLRKAQEDDQGISSFYPSSWFYKSLKSITSKPLIGSTKVQNSELSDASTEPIPSKPSPVTEKIEVLDSLNLFSEEKLAEKESFQFKGGELRKKEKVNDNLTLSLSKVSEVEFLEIMKSKSTKSFDTSSIKAMFITDESIDFLGTEENIFLKYFSSEVSQLFSNMVKAMNLDMNEIYISSLVFNEKSFEGDLLKELSFLKPKFIFCLGAKATNYFFKSQQRLKDCHGQIKEIDFKIEGEKIFKANFMPLFSPKLLHTAPNMKRLAWNDMQKAMNYLKD